MVFLLNKLEFRRKSGEKELEAKKKEISLMTYLSNEYFSFSFWKKNDLKIKVFLLSSAVEIIMMLMFI